MRFRALLTILFLTILLILSACKAAPTPSPAPTPSQPISIHRSLDKTSVELNKTLSVTLNYNLTGSFTGLIVIEKIPTGWEIIDSTPEVSAYDPSIGEAKWLLKSKGGISSGSIVYSLKVLGETGPERISGEWKAIDSEGNIHTETIEESVVTVK